MDETEMNPLASYPGMPSPPARHTAQAGLLVLVHGAGCDGRIWRGLQRAAQASALATWAIDLPGHGLQAGPGLPSISAMAQWLAHTLSQEPGLPVVLCGHSMGGLVALQTAALLPQQAVGLALMGCIHPMPVAASLLNLAQNDPQAAMARVARACLKKQADGHPSKRPLQALLHMMQHNEAQHQPHGPLLVRDLQACNSCLDTMEWALQVPCPSLMLCGSEDRMTPASQAQALATALKADSVMLACGHSPMAEMPRTCWKHLQAYASEWLAAGSSPI